MEKRNIKAWDKVRARGGIAILITAAAFMLMISGLQQTYARKQIRKGLEKTAEMELIIKTLNIKSVLESVESALNNHAWEIEQLLPYPDSLFGLTQRLVEQNPTLDGCCIAMVPDYYPEKGRLFEPYTIRRDSGIETYQLGSEEHDYSTNLVFIETIEQDTSVWSEPYPNPEEPDVTLVTHTHPIHDKTGKVVGSIGVDLNTEWLGSILNSRHLYPSSYNLLLSEEGHLICGPDAETVNPQEVDMMVALLNDSTCSQNVSTSGRFHTLNFNNKENGSKGFVYSMSPGALNSWRLAVVNYKDEVFQPLKSLRWRNLLLTLVGLLVFAFIIQRSAHNLNKLEKANLEKERIDNELNIAKNIQMDMLPKAEQKASREDVDIYGSLVPAKIVGGDLYDHFIRDEKLFFCIGDVSGKGVPAALVMAVVHTLFRSISAHESHPGRIMHILNENACQGNDTNMFVTFFIGVLDLPTGKLRYCNAGHNGPFIVGNSIRILPAKANLPLGVVDDMVYVAQEEILAPNEALFLYTDGVTEAKNSQHEQFDMTRLEKTLMGLVVEGAITPKHLIDKVNEQVNAFVQDAEQSDDLTMLAIQYTRKAKDIIFQDTLTISNKLSEITRLNTFVISAADALHLEMGLTSKLKLAVEEAVVNIIDYAYPSGTDGTIEIHFEADSDCLRFLITDTGAECDPTSVSQADTTLSVEDRPIGGLGVFLVRNLMDSINYERHEGKNILRLEKQYKQ